MIIGKDSKRIKEIDGKEYEETLGLYTRYRYVPPYRCDVHQVHVPDVEEEKRKQERIKEILDKSEQRALEKRKKVEAVFDENKQEKENESEELTK